MRTKSGRELSLPLFFKNASRTDLRKDLKKISRALLSPKNHIFQPREFPPSPQAPLRPVFTAQNSLTMEFGM